ncbi:MAG: hypothetical protein F4227_01065 [Gammaproteobacteria bacterium]|nr:hypothetical protein [Gammaproteobacteria bacterium]MYF01599.1 hypothetical protein [Gammaproteobacteria bacterium]MYI76461.1 hypothetical protein [Gammaproteobacteria bacterium]
MDFDYEHALTELKQRKADDRNEEDVKVEIVEPVLRDVLGYSSQDIRREHQLKSKRLDFLCRRPDGKLDVIVEAKALGVNLDLRPSRSDSAKRIPKIQLEEYLRKRPDSEHGVFGLLTNGEEWRVCRRIENDIVWLSSAIAPTSIELRLALKPMLSRAMLPDESSKYSTTLGQEILDHITSSTNHHCLLKRIAGEELYIQEHTKLVSSFRTEPTSTSNDDLLNETYFVTLGSLAQDGILSVADVYDALRETYLLHSSIRVSGIGIAFGGDSESETACRVFAWDGNTLHTSNSFSPDLPGTRVLRQLESLARWKSGRSNQLIEQLNARSIQKEFYDEIAAWFKRTGTELNDLRHLVRILFTWFLKEHGIIPTELFEKHADIHIHDQLEHLFTQTLSMEQNRRKVPKRLQTLKEALYDAPFLNGSLFNEDKALLRTLIPDLEYIRAGKSEDGLFTILKRYDWTLTEHDELRSDTALDPSMIGSVFERFIALAENIEPSPLARQPAGTYYTPQDLTDEMVCDALAYYLSGNLEGIAYTDALNLLHPVEGDTKGTQHLRQSPLKEKIVERLRKVTVLDPCTGSGEFIVSVLNALRRTERRLLEDAYDDLKRVEHAIEHQLYAVDVHPMAIQVTRFRFYLAMIGTQTALQPNKPIGPFPNLETRIATANSLATRLMDEHVEFESSHLHSTDMREWRKIRDSYTDAYSPAEKKKQRDRESRARQKLIDKLYDPLPYVIEWLEKESLGNESIVAECGLPLLFGKERWDVVIGNPPYQTPSGTEKRVANQYGYETTNCGDLYCLFVELGIKLLGETGVLTMVVPHSLCFSAYKKKLRELCADRAQTIHLRTYNNRPSPVFLPHPFIKGGSTGAESRQRVTVVSILVGSVLEESSPIIYSSSYIGLQTKQRKQILRCRPSYQQPIADRWTTAGTEELVQLLTAMRGAKTKITVENATREITFPRTAHYFLTCLPREILDSARRRKFSVPNDEYFWPRICLYNSTVFLAYWLMVGDAFDVLPSLFETVRLPPTWTSDPSFLEKAAGIGREFCNHNTLNRCMTVFVRKGKKFPNYNFSDNAPELVRDADRACIKGYALENREHELLNQIQQVRLFHTWNL